MKYINRFWGVLLFSVSICMLTGCNSKVVANKVKFVAVTENVISVDEITSLLDEAQKKEEEIPVTVEKEEPVKQEKPEKPAENKVVSNTKPNTSNTNKNTSSKYPYYIKVNRLANCVTIYKQDENGAYTIPIKAMICSVGKNLNNTPTGVFKTSDKYTWRFLFGNQYGQYATRIMGHILFHSVPYTSQTKDTLKTDYYNNLGVADSMGCIRLTCADAKWIYDNCARGTTVEIYDSSDPGPLGKPEAMKIDMNSPCAGWDPTDPDSNNPWKTQKPVISGVADITVECGNEVDYISDVTAKDAYGNSVQVVVTGNVDINICGLYEVVYSATDSNGNTATATAVVTVIEPIENDKEENV